MYHSTTDTTPIPLTANPRDRLAANPDALFVYGTLQFGKVLEALLGRVPNGIPAAAAGWRAAALEHRVYPGLVAAAGSTAGLVLRDLSPAEWRTLDGFEDDRYDLRRLTLTDSQHAWAYVWPDGEVLPQDWDPATFTARHLAAYAARCAALTARRHSPAC
ncbi:gamma-glutamylcyclotransferase family protein [Streptomyces sp. NPDC058280]|uniref:gamma-glutamylcyclotransferase family protein n=1 Tax=Streptomyces sp. NPDC058280 TaxID=3346419 RepID=UPI0036E7B3C2